MDKLSYALGMSMASSLLSSGMNRIDVDSFAKAFTAVINGETTQINAREANQTIQEYLSKRQNGIAEENRKAGNDFLEKNRTKKGVTTLASGLQYEILTEGSGPKPRSSDRVRCHYHGTLINGKVFDSSVERGQPAVFGVNQVIKGWVEALQLMPVGSKWRLYIPSDLAYGSQGAGNSIEPDSVLIFEVELLGIE